MKCIDSARRFGVEIGGLGDDDNVGAIGCGAPGNRQSDAARGARDEQGCALQPGVLAQIGHTLFS